MAQELILNSAMVAASFGIPRLLLFVDKALFCTVESSLLEYSFCVGWCSVATGRIEFAVVVGYPEV